MVVIPQGSSSQTQRKAAEATGKLKNSLEGVGS